MAQITYGLELDAAMHAAQRTSPVGHKAQSAEGNTFGGTRRARSESSSTQRDVIDQLAREVRKLESSGRTLGQQVAISTGCEAMDACLPHRGYVPGSIVEYLRVAPACGASYLAFAAAAEAMKQTAGFLVLVDIDQHFYPPALQAHGMDLEKVIFVRPESLADGIWAVDQALRTPAVAAVVAELDRIDDRAARRLQLAAESGDGLALLLRGAVARKQPSWAEVQWLVGSRDGNARTACASHSISQTVASRAARRLRVKLVRHRSGIAGQVLPLEIDSITGRIESADKRDRHEQKAAMRLASELASAKSPSRRATAG